ncbi:MAG: PorP/SprF family type IX secretion system membrane protein, partial [Bacteroidota bacterium]
GIFFCPEKVLAQDPHFTQFYSSPLYINPAFSGTASHEGRLIFHFRNQWPRLPGEFLNFQLSYDHRFRKSRNSLGAYASFDRAGSAGIQSSSINLVYSYKLPVSELLSVKAGMQVGYHNRSLDYFKLVFGDQLGPRGLTGGTTAEPNLSNPSARFIDVGLGFLAYTENFWLGLSAQHINQPDQSVSELEDQLPMRISVHAGYKFTFYRPGESNRKDYSVALNPGAYYSQQGDFKQLDVGANAYLDPIIFGIWYRGVPISSGSSSALALLAGFRYKNFEFYYNYDYAIGEFSNLTGGAHEFSLFMLFGELDDRDKRKRGRRKSPFFPSIHH